MALWLFTWKDKRLRNVIGQDKQMLAGQWVDFLFRRVIRPCFKTMVNLAEELFLLAGMGKYREPGRDWGISATPLHRLVASVLGLLIVLLAFIAMRRKRQRIIALALIVFGALTALRNGARYRVTAIVTLVLVTLEFMVGVAAILTSLPIGLAVAHNWLAGLLLLTLVRQTALSCTGNERMSKD